jgi:DNA-binding transcriptional LysR family regulator
MQRDEGPVALVPHRPRLLTDDLSTMRTAALAGIGVAQLPSLMAEADIAAGRLVELLPGWRLRNDTVHAIFPTRRGLLPSLRVLLDFLAAECLPFREGTRREG